MNRSPHDQNRVEKLQHAQNLLEQGLRALELANLPEGLLFVQEAFLIQVRVLEGDAAELNEIIRGMIDALARLERLREAKGFFSDSIEACSSKPPEEMYLLGVLVERAGNQLSGLQRLEDAREWYELALGAYTCSRGPEDRQVLYLLQKLVGLTYNLGDLAAAKDFVQRVLELDVKLFGEVHPKMAADLGSLGNIYEGLGELEQAKAAYQRAIAIDEQSLNLDNPRLTADLDRLAGVLVAMGDLDEAAACRKRILATDEKTFGPNHPKVSSDLVELAEILDRMGDLEGTKMSYRRALAIYQSFLPEDDPKIAALRKRLGDFDKGSSC